jgi:hypothetical protein
MGSRRKRETAVTGAVGKAELQASVTKALEKAMADEGLVSLVRVLAGVLEGVLAGVLEAVLEGYSRGYLRGYSRRYARGTRGVLEGLVSLVPIRKQYKSQPQ